MELEKLLKTLPKEVDCIDFKSNHDREREYYKSLGWEIKMAPDCSCYIEGISDGLCPTSYGDWVGVYLDNLTESGRERLNYFLSSGIFTPFTYTIRGKMNRYSIGENMKEREFSRTIKGHEIIGTFYANTFDKFPSLKNYDDCACIVVEDKTDDTIHTYVKKRELKYENEIQDFIEDVLRITSEIIEQSKEAL